MYSLITQTSSEIKIRRKQFHRFFLTAEPGCRLLTKMSLPSPETMIIVRFLSEVFKHENWNDNLGLAVNLRWLKEQVETVGRWCKGPF